VTRAERWRRAALVLVAATVAACSRPLPEEGTTDAMLYRAKCGTCHAAYQPHGLTPAMWQLQVVRMEKKYRAAGQQAPTADERNRILAYLTRNAGGN
jgi:hypothetical protein